MRSGLSMHGLHCSFAYSALASFRMGMSGSAFFQSGEEVLVIGMASGGVACQGIGTGKAQIGQRIFENES